MAFERLYQLYPQSYPQNLWIKFFDQPYIHKENFLKINCLVVMLACLKNNIEYIRFLRTEIQRLTVKKDIHPAYNEITVTCSCGNIFQTQSTLKEDLSIEVCSACHPFYTGQQKIVDTAGRVDKFRRRYGAKD